MPNDANSRGVSAVTGFVLFLALINIAYINATYEGAFGSIPIAIATGVIALSMFLKFAYAVGITYKVTDILDRVLFFVPFLTLGVFIWNGLNYWQSGYAGFVASLAIAGGIGAVIFGLTDGIAAVMGEKYQKASEKLHDVQVRVASAKDALIK